MHTTASCQSHSSIQSEVRHEMCSSVQSQVKQTEVHTLLLRDKSASVFNYRLGRKYTLLLRDKDRAVWSGSKRVVNFPW